MNARIQLRTPLVVEVSAIDESGQRAMYALYERYYEGTGFAVFRRDLLAKDHVVLLHGADGALQGFSTLAVYAREFEGRPLRVIFSGDTIVDQRCWGSQTFAFAWLRLAGAIKARAPATPLYWLLISKGQRTYRYLPAFSRTYWPAPDCLTPAPVQALMAFLATERFGASYDAAAGVLRFDGLEGRLRPRYAAVPDKDLRLPQVRYFLERNPGYARGDELVCLCELSAENLRPIARRVFESGATDTSEP